MGTKVISIDEFKALITKDAMETLELEFMELTSNPSAYTKDVFISKVLSIKDRQDNLIRDTLKTIPSKTVKVVTYTATINGEEVQASVELIETKGTANEPRTPFVTGDKIQLVHGDNKSPVYTVTAEGKVELDGVVSKPSHIVGSFLSSCGMKIPQIVNSNNGTNVYNISGLSNSKWSKVN